MQFYKSEFGKLPATNYAEAKKLARRQFHIIEDRNPHRLPYIRSAYFEKQKVFISQFWDHLDQKNRSDGYRRVLFLACAYDVIAHTRLSPDIKINPHVKHERLYRFGGETIEGIKFYVQVKENIVTGRRDLLSVLPEKRFN